MNNKKSIFIFNFKIILYITKVDGVVIKDIFTPMPKSFTVFMFVDAVSMKDEVAVIHTRVNEE